MILTLIALATALLSAWLVLSGLRDVVRDTVGAVAETLSTPGARIPVLAFAALWLMIFALGMA